MSKRLIQWDPLRIRLDAAALQTLLGDKLKVTFKDGSLDVSATVAGATAGARLTLSVSPAGAITATVEPIVPPIADVKVDSVQIGPDGITLLLAAGGADLPEKKA